MSLSREQMLFEMGITPRWTLRDDQANQAPTQPVAEAQPLPERIKQPAAETPQPQTHCVTAASGLPVPSTVDSLNWAELEAGIRACRACELCQQRKQAVPGVGDLQPDWLFIGEGPGAEEDVKGEPFVGQAGKLLDAMLAAIDLQRGNKVYIANAVKCRPPGNRTPEAGEMASCRPWLQRQTQLLQPKVIVLLGKAAAHTVLGNDKSLASLRGQRFEYQQIPVVVTYHPAYLLRNLPDKAKAWEDLLFARRVMKGK